MVLGLVILFMIMVILVIFIKIELFFLLLFVVVIEKLFVYENEIIIIEFEGNCEDVVGNKEMKMKF